MLRFVTYCGLAPVLVHTKNESKVSSTVGATAKMPLNMPETYCNWEGSGGVNLLELGEYLRDINDSDRYQPVGFFSFSIGY